VEEEISKKSKNLGHTFQNSWSSRASPQCHIGLCDLGSKVGSERGRLVLVLGVRLHLSGLGIADGIVHDWPLVLVFGLQRVY